MTPRSGPALTVVRDADGRPVRLDSSAGPSTALAVEQGALATVGYPDGGAARLTSDPGGLLTGWTDAAGVTTTFAYDAPACSPRAPTAPAGPPPTRGRWPAPR
ncbi:hypothetical protein BJF78_08055 [Pseudonocardia sp. CNS-139]|nr:hypothetical protein BJF78_08055 [Pseudonocardia sp. CNS-139]